MTDQRCPCGCGLPPLEGLTYHVGPDHQDYNAVKMRATRLRKKQAAPLAKDDLSEIVRLLAEQNRILTQLQASLGPLERPQSAVSSPQAPTPTAPNHDDLMGTLGEIKQAEYEGTATATFISSLEFMTRARFEEDEEGKTIAIDPKVTRHVAQAPEVDDLLDMIPLEEKPDEKKL